jgi:hypothetical protein
VHPSAGIPAIKHVEILRSADGDWVAVAVNGELAHSEHDFDDASLPSLLKLLGCTVTEMGLHGDTDEFD